MVDQRKTILEKGIIILLNAQGNKIAVVCGVTDNLINAISAKEIVSNLCEQLNGKGGGRPDFAQGAGETENINDFVTKLMFPISFSYDLLFIYCVHAVRFSNYIFKVFADLDSFIVAVEDLVSVLVGGDLVVSG